jgi:toxoflavin synthase
MSSIVVSLLLTISYFLAILTGQTWNSSLNDENLKNYIGRKMMKSKYDHFACSYDKESRMDHPIRKMLYERWLQECGEIEGKDVIDFGCGAGVSTRMLRDRGAQYVRGVDNSEEMLNIARIKEKEEANPISYSLHNIFSVLLLMPAHLATAVLSVHYASSSKELEKFFFNTQFCLWKGGKFVAVILDPNNPIISYWPGAMSSHRWLKKRVFRDGSAVETTIYDANGSVICPPFINYHWKKKTYEKVLIKNGFSDIRWIKDGGLEETALVILTAKKE